MEACKILGWKDEVGKSRAGWVMTKLTWLDHVEPVICRSRDHDITEIEIERNSSHLECRCRIIGRLMTIEVLWESFHPNTPFKDEFSKLHSSFIYYSSLSSFFVIFSCHHSSPSPSYSIYRLGSLLPIFYLEAWTVLSQASTIKPVTLANLTMFSYHQASFPDYQMIYWRVDILLLLCHLIIAG